MLRANAKDELLKEDISFKIPLALRFWPRLNLYTLNPLLSSRGAYFFQALLRGGLFNLAKRITCNKLPWYETE